MLERTRGFTRDGCIVGVWRVTYNTLLRWYVCSECGGQPVSHISGENGETAYWAECGNCGERDFITARHYQRQLLEYNEITEGLPPFLRALLPEKEQTDLAFEQAMDELFGDY